jgi:hypothetical protein
LKKKKKKKKVLSFFRCRGTFITSKILKNKKIEERWPTRNKILSILSEIERRHFKLNS